MTYSEIIKKTFATVIRNLIDFAIVIIVFSILNALLEILVPGQGLLKNLGIGNFPSVIFGTKSRSVMGNMTDFVFQTIRMFIINTFVGANYMAMLDFLRGYTYGIREIKEKIQHFYPILIPVVALYTLADQFIGLVPIIGGILSLIVRLALMFIYFLIEDYPDLGPMDYLKLSYELTDGYKFKMAITVLIFSVLPMIFVILLTIGAIPGIILGGAVVILPILLLALIPIFISNFLASIAITIFYEEEVSNKLEI